MKETQLLIFTDTKRIPFEPKKLARTEDPGTSHEAARQSGELRSLHHRKIMAAFDDGWDKTAYEIADLARMEVAAVFRRLSELANAGLIYANDNDTRTGPTGRKCRVWRAERSLERAKEY